MSVRYFKRYRMEIDLDPQACRVPPLPAAYQLLAWDPALLEAHAQTKYLSFRDELDACVFPCLGDALGCYRLMGEITGRDCFLPEATWLAVYERGGSVEYCGTVQGLRDPAGYGAIQNLGVVPGHRDHGLGTILLRKALAGFFHGGLRRAYLEVTAENERAVQLYDRLGFRRVRTVYKAVELAPAG